ALVITAVAGLAAGFALRRGPPVLAAGEAPAGGIPFFGYCLNGGGANCVVDGDTFYFGTDKVGIAGIDAPETHPPRCAAEARLGEAATHRLRDLLNSGEVTLSRIGGEDEIGGRKLRHVVAGGADVGAVLVEEGLAREYGTGRRSWCA
ncbi:MAG: thermonuclease family protein, partial [Hyphomicrobium sp.]|nr:thermonuclease family protein [Hyphomicrobium sp.]